MSKEFISGRGFRKSILNFSIMNELVEDYLSNIEVTNNMSTAYAKHISNKNAPQTVKVDERQVANSAGGFSFELDKWKQLDRFLILGTEGGSYYANEQKMSVSNAKNIINLIKEDGARVLNRVVEVSERGMASKNDPALFVMALIFTHANTDVKKLASEALPKVARIGTHLFTFVEYVNELRGWGRGLRNAVQSWYSSKDENNLMHQITKYQQRNGWSHKDVLKLSHYPNNSPIIRYALGLDLGDRKVERRSVGRVDRYDSVGELPEYLQAVEALKKANGKEAVQLISKYNMPREVVPTELLNSKEVWEVLLENMLKSPKTTTALIRNLATLTRVGLVAPLSSWTKRISETLHNQETLHKARIHPIAVLTALMTYNAGRGMRGSNTWTPVPAISSALDDAFYLTFDNVEPTGKNTLLALDVSGSMTMGAVGGVQGLTPRVASVAMALVTAKVEKNYHIMGFSRTFIPLNISADMRLEEAMRVVNNLPFSSTDCSLPMVWAKQNKIPAEAIAVYTDSETYAGRPHPHVALQELRKAMNIQSRLAVVGMVANKFTIADPSDAGMLDVVGFSTDSPSVLSNFFKGEL